MPISSVLGGGGKQKKDRDIQPSKYVIFKKFLFRLSLDVKSQSVRLLYL